MSLPKPFEVWQPEAARTSNAAASRRAVKFLKEVNISA